MKIRADEIAVRYQEMGSRKQGKSECYISRITRMTKKELIAELPKKRVKTSVKSLLSIVEGLG